MATDMERYWIGKILWPDGIGPDETVDINQIARLADICLDILEMPIPVYEEPEFAWGEIDPAK